ncbi:Sas10 C-terminal domain-containing protein [Dichomitus squalens]|nr:Sas10 C-terminal domain-containing protein [Dichomitus squalens]
MVRRRSGKAKAAQKKPRSVDRKDSKMKRWNTAADIPMDEEDQFHASRDKILLEGDDHGGDEDGDEDEVFALKGMPQDSPSEDEEDADQDGDGMDEDDHIDDVHYAAAAASKKQKQKKTQKKGKKSKKDESEEEESESEEEEGWGTKKSAYYASNADEIESDDEEALELEEQEAKRLQAKVRDAMADDDFGLGDVVEGLPDEDGIVDEPVQPVVQLPQDKQSLLRHLEKTNPEALALAHDWDDVAYNIVKSKAKIEKLQAENPDALSLSMMHLHYQALLTYATTLAFYLHLRASEKYTQRPELLRAHPILPRLLTLKQSLHTLEELDFAASDDESGLGSSDLDDSEDEEDEEFDWQADAQDLWAGNNTLKKKGKGLEQHELEELLREAEGFIDVDGDDLPKAKTIGKDSRAGKDSVKTKRKSKVADGEPEPPKKKRKATDASAQLAMPVFDLVEPDLAPSKSSKKEKSKATDATVDVYGEATALDVADAADKQARKKSLRFHVARIESTSARRAGARAANMGGDDDIPYRERKKEREARLAKEVAKAREREAQGADLDDVDPELQMDVDRDTNGKNGKKRRRGGEDEDEESGGEADGYYELVKRKSKEKKEKRKQEYEDAAAAARIVDEEGVDGPRSLTRAILKNKGLTPKRSKSVRNPRVKKRQKYEKAKKKVASQRAVYKGGVDASKYGGEKTGISQTIKSVRL